MFENLKFNIFFYEDTFLTEKYSTLFSTKTLKMFKKCFKQII